MLRYFQLRLRASGPGSLVKIAIVVMGFLLMGCTGQSPSDCVSPQPVMNTGANDSVQIRDVQLSQGISISDTTELVMGRSTAIRIAFQPVTRQRRVRAEVHVCAEFFPSRIKNDITGKIQGTRSDVYTLVPPSPSAPFRLPQDDDTLNLTLEYMWDIYSGISETQLPKELAITGWIVIMDVDTGQPIICWKLREHKAVRTRTPQINYVPMEYPLGIWPTQITANAQGFVQSTFPIYDNDPRLYKRLVANKVFTCPIDSANSGVKHLIRYGRETCILLRHLEAIRSYVVTNGTQGVGDDVFVYGLVAGDPFVDKTQNGDEGYHGISVLAGRVGLGNTTAERGQRTMAHEMLHNFGFDHPAKTNDFPSTKTPTITLEGWDVTKRLINSGDPFWVSNGITARIKLPDRYELIVPGITTDQAWISGVSYNRLRNVKFFDASLSGVPIQNLPYTLRVSGCAMDLLSRNGLKLYPLEMMPWRITPIQFEPDPSRRFTLIVTAENGTVKTVPFDPRVGTDPDDPLDPDKDIRYGYFSLLVPYEPGWGRVASIQIVNPLSQTVLQQTNTGAPLGITITQPGLSPVPTNTFTETGAISRSIVITATPFTVAWEINDPLRRRPDGFEYQVTYSHNNGRDWVPIAVNLPGTIRSVPIDIAGLCPSAQATGVIRVFASDGFNTTFQDLSNIIVVDTGLPDCDRTYNPDGVISTDSFTNLR